MTNEEYEQWKPLIKKVAWKYSNNRYNLELDDLEQIAAIGVMKAFDTYNDEKEMSINTWIYNNAEWTIQRQFLYLNRIKNQSEYKTISLSTPIEDDLYLEDMIADDKDHMKTVEDRLIVKAYKKEIDMCITRDDHRIIVKKCLFSDSTLNQIAQIFNTSQNRVRQIRDKGYRTLKEKSPMIRAKYLEYIERREEQYLLDVYSNPERIVIRTIESNRIKLKYKKEIAILSLVQELFDYIDGYSHVDCKIKKFYLLGLTRILEKTEIEILDRYLFKNEDINDLVKEGYDYYNIFRTKEKIKTKIAKNKEKVYELWEGFDLKGGSIC